MAGHFPHLAVSLVVVRPAYVLGLRELILVVRFKEQVRCCLILLLAVGVRVQVVKEGENSSTAASTCIGVLKLDSLIEHLGFELLLSRLGIPVCALSHRLVDRT